MCVVCDICVFQCTDSTCYISRCLHTCLDDATAFAGFKDDNGVLTRESMRKQYNGELFHEYAKKWGKSMKEKKGQGKHLQ